jgi:3'-phosphoadenosine 5'-phosphosulfate sulfotransferase (PAPS reductase)/FAD synthetase
LQNPKKTNKNIRRLRLTGITSEGKFAPSYQLSKKWVYLVDAPFKISDSCCDYLKKRPLDNYAKETQSYSINATMACESKRREQQYLNQGCNAFNLKNPMSQPMGFWLEEDVWSYIKKFKIPYSKIYDMGEKRTGCIFCMFGVHMEKEPNRFQRMQYFHPALYNYCINQLKLKNVLSFLKVPYKNEEIKCLK